MTKVPVGRSIAHAYEFLFGRFFQIIGTAWLPALVYGVGYYLVLEHAQAWVNSGDPASLMRMGGLVVLALLAAVLIHAVIAVSLTQEALGVRKDLTLAHFVVGPRELRLFFGLLLYFLLFAVLYTLVVVVCFGLVMAAQKYGAGLAPNLILHGSPAAVVGAAAIAAIVLAWFWLSMLRLLFLLAPIASVEHRLRLGRAWQLTRGSTFRTFIVLVVVFVPVMIVAWTANRFVLHIGPMTALQPHADPMAVLTQVLAFYGANAGSLAIVAGGLAVLNGALLAGASAAAYRTLTHHEEAEPEDDTPLVAPLLVAEEPRHGEDGHGAHNETVAHDEHHGNGGHDDHHRDHHADHHDAQGEEAGHDDHHGHSEGHGDSHAHSDGGTDSGHGGHAHADAHGTGAHGDGDHQDDHDHGGDGNGDHQHDDHDQNGLDHDARGHGRHHEPEARAA
jgi:hypothetical protein